MKRTIILSAICVSLASMCSTTDQNTVKAIAVGAATGAATSAATQAANGQKINAATIEAAAAAGALSAIPVVAATK